MKKRPYYFDYAASTPVDPRVAERLCAFLTAEGHFGNSASLHAYGEEALNAIQVAREQVANAIGAEASEIIFTSGATEANNLALKGGAAMYQRRGKHIITFKTEHKAVLDPCQQLEKEGFEVSYLAPIADGSLDWDALVSACRPDTFMISAMHVNNETGVIYDLARLSAFTREKNILLHVDAAQSVGKVPLNVSEIQADFISLSAHKVYGPKGVGALYLRKKPRVRVLPFIQGGGQEQGMRSGTLPTHQIVGMGEAFALAGGDTHIQAYSSRLLAVIQDNKNLRLNAATAKRVPHILNIQCLGKNAETLLQSWPDIAASTAAACQGKSIEGSHVLRAMGLSLDAAKSSIRLSLGRFTTEEAIETLTAYLKSI